MKKAILCVLLAAAMLTLVCSCGDSAGSSASKQPSTASSVPTRSATPHESGNFLPEPDVFN